MLVNKVMDRRLLFGIVTMALLLASCAQPSVEAPPYTETPTPTPTDIPAPIPEEILKSHFGFLGASFEAAELTELGVRWDRPHPGPFIWNTIEREMNKYDWREVDRYVQEAQNHNLATLATIWPFAEWDQANWKSSVTIPATTSLVFENELGGGRRKPHDIDAYKRFIRALVERYDGDGKDDMPKLRFPIKYWEVSNEPSMQHGFNTFFSGSPEDYLEILKATYTTIKEADTSAEVLHAGMAGMEPWMVSFWEPVFEKGGQCFDIANIHSLGASDELNVPEFKALLSKYDINKPIWVTEAQHRVGKGFDGRDISPEEHGNIFTRSYVISFACGTDKVFYTTFKAPPFGPQEFEESALIDRNGERRPAYYALQTLIQKLEGFTSVEKLAEGQYKFTVTGEVIYVLWDSGSEEIESEVLFTNTFDGTKGINNSTANLTESPWPMFHKDAKHTGMSSYDTSHVDGTLKWSFETGAGIESSPVIGADRTIYIGSHDGKLYAVNPDGTEKWHFDAGDPLYDERWDVSKAIMASPAIAKDGTIYIYSSANHLFAVSPDGTEKWRFYLKWQNDFWSSPTIGSDGTIYIGSARDDESEDFTSGLYAINPDGTEKWHFELGSGVTTSAAIADDGTIYIGAADASSDKSIPDTGKILAIDPSGEKKWEFETELWMESSATIGPDGTIYIGSGREGKVYALNPDGTQRWHFQTGDGVSAIPTV